MRLREFLLYKLLCRSNRSFRCGEARIFTMSFRNLGITFISSFPFKISFNISSSSCASPAFIFFKISFPMKKDRTENIQKTYKKCAPYGNCTEIVQKIYKKCAKFCNSSLVETGSLFELLQILAHFLYIFCTITVQFLYDAHFLYVFCMFSYVFCMFSVRSFFIGLIFETEALDPSAFEDSSIMSFESISFALPFKILVNRLLISLTCNVRASIDDWQEY